MIREDKIDSIAAIVKHLGIFYEISDEEMLEILEERLRVIKKEKEVKQTLNNKNNTTI